MSKNSFGRPHCEEMRSLGRRHTAGSRLFLVDLQLTSTASQELLLPHLLVINLELDCLGSIPAALVISRATLA